MSSRRGSVTFVPKALPYRIDFTNTETGKLIASSKRVIVWKFGYPDTDDRKEENVTLKHSVTGGKKVVFENGKEIITVGMQSVITDFAHTWESNGHVLRVAVGKNHEYSFNVDGVLFEDFPSEFEARSMAKELASKSKDGAKRSSVKKVESTTGATTTISPNKTNSSFDPFSSEGNTSASTNTVSSSSFFDNKDDGFGGFGNDPFSSNKSSTVDPFSSGFGGTTTQDPFSSSFGSTPAQKPKSASAKLFNDVEEDPSPTMTRQFTSPHDHSSGLKSNDFFADSNTHLPPPKQQQPQHQQQKHQPATLDFFADNTPPPQQKQQQQPAVTPSSVFDFSGMTYEAPVPVQQKPLPDIRPPEPVPQPQKQPEPESFLNGLVNLDLSSNKPARQQQRKSIYDGSTSAGPSGYTSTQQTHQSINPFDDFNVSPSPQHPQYNTSANYTPNFNTYGNTGGYNNAGVGMTPQSLYNGGAANIGMMNSGGYTHGGATQTNPNQKPKTSLDTLNWKM